MEFSTIVWFILVLLSVVVPAVRRWQEQRTRQSIVRRLERQRGSRVITLIHRQEALAILGIPLARYITIEDSERVLQAIRATPADKAIDLILHTPGGLVLAAEQIAQALRQHQGPVTVFVPHYAMSGGTLIALVADHLHMDPGAVLGPVDPQLGQYPAASLLRLRDLKDPAQISDQFTILIDLAEKAMPQVRAVVTEVLGDRMERAQAEELAAMLTDGRWTHDYPLHVDQLRELGLNVGTDVPHEVYALMALFPQTGEGRPSALYVPVDRRAPARETAQR